MTDEPYVWAEHVNFTMYPVTKEKLLALAKWRRDQLGSVRQANMSETLAWLIQSAYDEHIGDDAK